MREADIINIFQRNLGIDTCDDVGIFETGGAAIAVNTDAISEGTDIPPGSSLDSAGYRSVASCVSDFAAKGMRPESGVISVSLPKDVSPRDVEALARGVAQAADEFGIRIVGGDTGQGAEIALHVTLFGSAGNVVPRGGANRGDDIYVTGPFGIATAGLKVLLEGMGDEDIFAEQARQAVLRPRPPLEFGIMCGPLATSSMDSSDGLAICLNDMAKQSDKMFLIDTVPTTSEARRFAAKNDLDIIEMVFYGGGEYEMVFTAAPGDRRELSEMATTAGVNLHRIGTVRSGNGAYLDADGIRAVIGNRGWQHFHGKV